MQIKGKKIENRTILIVLLIILIIIGGYYLITSLPAEKKFLTPEDALNNKDRYLNGEIIVVRGYYDSKTKTIVSSMSNVAGGLNLDYDNVKNATDILINGHKFDFTGTLQEVNPDIPGSGVKFVASEIEAV